MGSLRALLVIGSLVGCEASGLRVDVILPEGGPAPDRVRLFVGVPAEDDRAMIGPEGFGVTRAGSRWVRDPLDGDDVLEVEPGADLSFGFLSDVDHAELGAVIAVGYTGTEPTSAGSLFHVKTGVGVVRVFKLRLFPAVDARDRENWTQPVQVQIWGPASGDEACVHLWNKHPDRDMTDPHDSAFIVSRNNRDCDRWLDDDRLECSANIHETNSPPIPHDFNCATFTVAPGVEHCVLGGPPCIDGEEPGSQCAPSNFCAPHSVCNACAQLPDAAARRDCIRAPYDIVDINTSAMYGVKCHIRTSRDRNGSGPVKVCPQEPTIVLPIPALMPAPTCSNAMIARVGERLGSHIESDDARLAVAVDAGCVLTLKPTGDVGVALTSSKIVNGIVTVDLDSGRSLALPLQVHLDPPSVNCDNQNHCTLVGDATDRPLACLSVKSPVTPP